jgi:hypothetical protein
MGSKGPVADLAVRQHEVGFCDASGGKAERSETTDRRGSPGGKATAGSVALSLTSLKRLLMYG